MLCNGNAADALSAAWPTFAPCAVPELLRLGRAAVECSPLLANHYAHTVYSKYGELRGTKRPFFQSAHSTISRPEEEATRRVAQEVGRGPEQTQFPEMIASRQERETSLVNAATRRRRKAELVGIGPPVQFQLLGSANQEVAAKVILPFKLGLRAFVAAKEQQAASDDSAEDLPTTVLQTGLLSSPTSGTGENALLELANSMLYIGEPYRTLNDIAVVLNIDAVDPDLLPTSCPAGSSKVPDLEETCMDDVCSCDGGGEPAVGELCSSSGMNLVQPTPKCLSCPAGAVFGDLDHSMCVLPATAEQTLGQVPATTTTEVYEAPVEPEIVVPKPPNDPPTPTQEVVAKMANDGVATTAAPAAAPGTNETDCACDEGYCPEKFVVGRNFS